MKLIKRTFPIIFAALAAVSIAVFYPGAGTLMTHDSVAYLFAAKGMAAGRGLLYFGYDVPMVQWPPIYPALLTPFFKAGMSVWQAADAVKYLNAALFGLTVWFVFRTVEDLAKNRVPAVIASTFVIFSPALTVQFFHLWSETLFLTLLAALGYFIVSYFKTGKKYWFYVSAASAALLIMTRYAGVAAAGSAALAVFLQRKPLKSRLFETLVFGGISLAPFAAWAGRNYMVSGTLLGIRMPSLTSFTANLKEMARQAAGWLTPSADKVALAAALALIAASAVIAAIVVFKKMRQPAGSTQDHAAYVFLAVNAAAYPLFILYSNTRYALDPVSARIMSPALLSFATLAFAAFGAVISYASGRHKASGAALKFILAGAVLISVAFGIGTLHDFKSTAKNYYAPAAWESNRLISYVRTQIPPGTLIYSNSADVVTYAGKAECFYPPRRAEGTIYSLEPFTGKIAAANVAYFVWFSGPESTYNYSIAQLKDMLGLEQVYAGNDGIIYKYSSGERGT